MEIDIKNFTGESIAHIFYKTFAVLLEHLQSLRFSVKILCQIKDPVFFKGPQMNGGFAIVTSKPVDLDSF
jgi:hypothetical protein